MARPTPAISVSHLLLIESVAHTSTR